MAGDFTIVAYTPELPVKDEAEKITALLRSGAADAVHLRHPALSAQEVASILADIPAALHPRIRIHDHFRVLIPRFNLGGAHVGSRASADDVKWLIENGIPTSKSCHTVAEVLALPPCFDGCTLSPVRPSISKSGYGGHFSDADLRQAAASGKRVIALGGVTPSNVLSLRRLGFGAAALLGWIWQGNFSQRLRALRMLPCFALQYITNGATPADVAAEVAPVLAGGCRWVQIRMKDAPDSDVAAAVELVKPMTDKARAILLLDDRVSLAASLGVDGVHLGKSDMPAAEARALLPASMIIGSTANTFANIARLSAEGASDYVGLGPLRFTSTKKNLAPTLGYDGYRAILSEMRAAAIHIPVVAIGSVAIPDCRPLLDAGASGVAVSGSIRLAPDPAAATSAFLTHLYEKI